MTAAFVAPPLQATTVTLQTALSLLTIPLLFRLAQSCK